MDAEMEITTTQVEGEVLVTVLQLKGEVGSHNYEELRDEAFAVIDGGAEHLLLDLTELTYMSSAGLRAMHAIYNKLQGPEEEASTSQRLKLLGPPPNILSLVNTIGFNIYVEIYDTLEEAVASFC
jgi:anti-sigma B factor antagonist